MIQINESLSFYKRRDIQQAIIQNSKNREVAVKFGDKGFGKRPDMLTYSNDILEFAQKGVTSFHISEEIWSNPMLLKPMMKPREINNIREGWDLILDIDCKELSFSKITTYYIIEALKYQGIINHSVKFSGNKGFHIGIPFKAFPRIVYGKDIRTLFPEGPRIIAEYLREMIRKHLIKKLLEEKSIYEITALFEKDFNDVVKNGEFDPFTVVDIDTILISNRHLYRSVYSFNEKSGLVSIPIDPEKVLEFNKESAKSENIIISDFKFLDDSKVTTEEASKLLVQSFDFDAKKVGRPKRMIEEREIEIPDDAIPEQYFPDCIKKILQGMPDGKKRALFVLTNFLTCVGWSYDQIEKCLSVWNKRNKEPLREVYILTHLKYHKSREKKILPPNCNNDMYYKDLGIYTEECKKIVNPVSYCKRQVRYLKKKKLNKNTKNKQDNKELKKIQNKQ